MKTTIEEKQKQKEKRKTVGYLDEKKKQVLRKKQNNVSRTLDNYYAPILHERAWWPNGLYKIKRGYNYGDSGLGYFYEKGNVEQLKDITDKSSAKNKKALQNYVEYDFLEENQFTVTIEYCANCEEHSTHTRHSADLYKGFALKLQKSILLRFPFINVLLKPIDTDILQEEEGKAGKGAMPMYVNDKFKEVRIGAMEVQICAKYKQDQETEIKQIHSKLKNGSWPKIPEVLDKIVSFLPMFKGDICLFDKEDDEYDEEKKDNSQDFIANSKLKGLQVNLYLLRNLKIEQLSEEAANDVSNDEDPHKRKEMILENRRKEKESMCRPTTASYRVTSANPNQRGYSPQSMKSSNGFNSNNNFNSTSRQSQTVTISDKSQVKMLKGKHLVTKYTNEDGIVEIGPLPYDSYFIEVVESTHFMGLGMPLSFYTINPPERVISSNPDRKIEPKCEVVKKFLGLYKQENAFLKLHIYETKKDHEGRDDQVHLPKCHVTLKTVKEEDYQDYLEEKESKIKIDEKKEGIFEHMVIPGRYLLEVTKENYEIVRKYCDLEKGQNSVNVEMTIERNCSLVITVYNFEKIAEEKNEPIQNAEIAIYKNSNDIVCEGITDKKGEMKYLVTKNEDFLTIIINKLSFYPVQRMFVRNKTAPINDKGEYEEHLVFFLVKENYLTKNNCTVIITYSNTNGPNFNPIFQSSDIINQNLDIKTIDNQNNFGILSFCVNYTQPNPEDKANSDNNQNDDEEDFEEIVRLSYEITNEALRVPNYQDKGCTMNGLERFCCQTIIYTMTNIFFIAAPNFSKDNYGIWDLGWFDPKNLFFYELSTLWSESQNRTIYFSHWLDFLQMILDKKIYLKLFEFFGYDKGILINNDRFIFEANFFKKLMELKFSEDNEQSVLEFICELVKNSNKLISFSLLKKKITSNLKNFREDLGVSRSRISDK